MNLDEIWQRVLNQLRLEMPRATFDSWVRDTHAITLENDMLTIGSRDADARDWLESRLTSTVQRLLVGILNQSVSVQFVVCDPHPEQEAADENDETELSIEPVQYLDYERIVQPQRQVVVKGYLRRLGMEIGPKAIWLYIGFHQAAWRMQGRNQTPLHSRDVMRFSALSNGAFWRLLKQETIRQHLTGLVQRIDPPDIRCFKRGRDGRPHRAPVRYQVFMSPRLTIADATAIHSRLKTLIQKHNSIPQALQELMAVEDVTELLNPLEGNPPQSSMNTVMDMVRLETDGALSLEVEHLAQELQRRIINHLGDIHVTHYFITKIIHQWNLTPAQAWLVTVARDMAYINSRTGERRDVVTFKRGYLEMAGLIGSSRYKTVQAWFNPQWSTQQRGGDLSRFLYEVGMPDSNDHADLRVESMPRSFRVLLDEPLDANGSNMVDADGGNSWVQMGAITDAGGSHMLDANGSALNSFKHPRNTDEKNTSTTLHMQSAKTAEAVAPDFWELESLLQQNDVHPKVQRELMKAKASVRALVSWLLYVASSQSGNLSNPLGYALSRLRENPVQAAHGIFRQLAGLPPAELLTLIDQTLGSPHIPSSQLKHPLSSEWIRVMDVNTQNLPVVREILFGKGVCK